MSEAIYFASGILAWLFPAALLWASIRLSRRFPSTEARTMIAGLLVLLIGAFTRVLVNVFKGQFSSEPVVGVLLSVLDVVVMLGTVVFTIGFWAFSSKAGVK